LSGLRYRTYVLFLSINLYSYKFNLLLPINFDPIFSFKYHVKQTSAKNQREVIDNFQLKTGLISIDARSWLWFT
jgi:hypothetical protein